MWKSLGEWQHKTYPRPATEQVCDHIVEVELNEDGDEESLTSYGVIHEQF
jgi:hypothetical protein